MKNAKKHLKLQKKGQQNWLRSTLTNTAYSESYEEKLGNKVKTRINLENRKNSSQNYTFHGLHHPQIWKMLSTPESQ